MKILLITIYYPPIISSLSVMMKEVADNLVKNGHDVTIGTAKPHTGLNLTDNQLRNSFENLTIENNVRVIRVKTPPLKSKLLFLRGIIQLLLPHIFYRAICKQVKGGFDVVIVSSPPLPLAKIGKMMKDKFKSKFILLVQDIYPESVIDIQAMKNNNIIVFFKKMAQYAYKNADIITSHTEGNRNYIINNNEIDSKNIYYLPNWIDPSPYKKNFSNKYRKEYNLEGGFIFLFAGIFGKGQGLERLISILSKTKKINSECKFLFVGEGSEKNKLMKITKRNKSKNIIFKPFIPLEDYPSLVGEVDVGILCLDSRLSTPVVPGKLLGFMASSLPVIGILNKESDGHEIIKKANCGYSINSDCNSEMIVELFIKIFKHKDRLKNMGNNGYKYLSNHFNKEVCLELFNKLLQKIK